MATNSNTSLPSKLELATITADSSKLKHNLETLTSLLCDSLYDQLIYKIQDNSTSQQYRRQVRDFLKASTAEFISQAERSIR